MHLRFEKASTARCDCPILSLSWMGKVPEELPDDEGWRLNRTHYYQEGWLAVGNMRGIVGVTFTTCHCRKVFDSPLRTNYNLRGHRSEVALVKWNEPYQKLASCDSSGIIFVWIKYEGRWSIELINDRNTQVMDFSWSHDGRMALICYQDGFVLVGSVAGQRYWSSMLNLEGTITCGVWSPDDQQVLFGTTDGQIIVMDAHGTMVAQVGVLDDVAVTSMSWSCQKFKMEESGREDDEEEGPAEISLKNLSGVDQTAVLGVCFKSGLVYIMKNYDDVFPVIIPTGLRGVKMDWTNAGDLLAIAGCASNSRTGEFTNILQFYTQAGSPRHCSVLPYTQHPVSALTWGHNDKRLFVATGPLIHIAWVSRQVATLQRLCSHVLRTLLREETNVSLLPLPRRLKNQVGSLFCATIKSYIPEPPNLREFASRPPLGNIRYHCTMIRHDDDLSLSSGTCYTLYLEYLGGLVPLLKGKRTSKIRPEFVIYDPQVGAEGYPGCENGTTETKSIISANGNGAGVFGGNGHVSGIGSGHLVINRVAELSDSEYEDGCASPRMQRRRRHMKRLLREQLELELRLLDNLTYVDTLPEQERLVEVTSNIWGTKFKLHGVAPFLPTVLGHVTYRTSLLHLQPRQMTLVVTELTGEMSTSAEACYNGPNIYRENDGKDYEDDDDDDELPISDDGPGGFRKGDGAPVAPMTPTHNRLRLRAPAPRAEIDSDPDEYPYVDFSANPHLLGLLTMERVSNSSPATPAVNTPETPVKTPDRDPLSFPSFNSSSPRRTSSCSGGGARRWAEKAAELRYIDEEDAHAQGDRALRTPVAQARLMSRCRSRSVGHLNSIDYIGGPIGEPNDSMGRVMGGVLRDSRRRLVLSQTAPLKMPPSCSKSKTPLNQCGKSRSLDSGSASHAGQKATPEPVPKTNPPVPVVPLGGNLRSASLTRSPRSGNRNVESSLSPVVPRRVLPPQSSPKLSRLQSSAVSRCARDLREDRGGLLRSPEPNRRGLMGQTGTLTPPHSPLLNGRHANALATSSASSSPILPRRGTTTPGSPQTPTRNFKAHQRKNSLLGRRSLLNSPLLGRRALQTRPADSSDDEVVYSGDEAFSDSGRSYDIRPRMKKGRNGGNRCRSASPGPTPPQRREFVMHNKAPLWNESSQVYQLDFGGRVTQESAKNFQIEFRGTQVCDTVRSQSRVMQFGRIDGNAYTLDFQYPFTAIQAFAVALANVTQRLK